MPNQNSDTKIAIHVYIICICIWYVYVYCILYIVYVYVYVYAKIVICIYIYTYTLWADEGSRFWTVYRSGLRVRIQLLLCRNDCVTMGRRKKRYTYRYRVIQQQERSPYIVLSTPNWHINLRRRAGACCCAVPPCPDRQGPWGLEHGWGSHACRESPADEEVRSKMGDSQAQRNKHQLRDNRSIT